MNNVLISLILSVVGTLSSIASLVVTLQSARRGSEDDKPIENGKPHNWPFWLILSVTMASLVLLFCGYYPSNEKVGWGVLVMFVVSGVSLFVYVAKAYRSLGDPHVLPPEKLWRVLFYKTPSHKVICALMGLSVVLLIAFVSAERKVVIRGKEINEKADSLAFCHEQMAKFGADRGKIYLPNKFIELSEVRFDIDGLRRDETFQKFMDGFATYFFGELKLEGVLLWLRNDVNDKLDCVYSSKGNICDKESKGEGTVIGGIANNAPIFVLWPGYSNKDSIWLDSKYNSMAWSNEDHGEYAVRELHKDSEGFNEALYLKEMDESQSRSIILDWCVNPKNAKNNNSNARALYGYSYDRRLAIELDFTPKDLNSDRYMRIYIQNLLFRNCVRKFTACVTSFLNCYAARIEVVDENEN